MSKTAAVALREGSRGSTGARRWTRDLLVAAQTALALVLLIGAGLLLRSYARLSHVNPGYSTRDLFTFQIAPEQSWLVDGSRGSISPSWIACARCRASSPMYRAYTMAFLAARSMRDLSFTMLTLGVVSLLALMLGVVGLYGAPSYVVAERGVKSVCAWRSARGPERVRRMVVLQGGRVVAAGVASASSPRSSRLARWAGCSSAWRPSISRRSPAYRWGCC